MFWVEGYAANDFCFGVMPPKAIILWRSLLYCQSHCVANAWTCRIDENWCLSSHWCQSIWPTTVTLLKGLRTHTVFQLSHRNTRLRLLQNRQNLAIASLNRDFFILQYLWKLHKSLDLFRKTSTVFWMDFGGISCAQFYRRHSINGNPSLWCYSLIIKESLKCIGIVTP